MKSTTILLVIITLHISCTKGLGRPRTQPLDFKGRYIVSISDADMLSSAYVDGKLGPREGKDALSIIPLNVSSPRQLVAYEVEASNSVAGPPAAIEITSDGLYAFVIETFTPRPPGGDGQDHTFTDLKIGNKLLVFDLNDLQSPKLVQTVEIGDRPDAISINATDDQIAISFNPQGGVGAEQPLALAPFAAGKVGRLVYPKIPHWKAGHRLINVEWHPTEPILALANATSEEISFVRVNGNSLEPWGNSVGIEKEPYMIKFSPNGKYLVSNALYWGPDVAGTWIEAPRGSVLSIKLNAGTTEEGTPRHALISRALTGVSPEGMNISPNGKYIVTTNLERSYLPYNDKRITWFSSISLFSFDQETGEIKKHSDFAYDGILPEAAVFDNSSQFVAVVTYDHFNDDKRGGTVDFWRITKDPLEQGRVILVKTEHSVPVTRGAHSMVIAR